MEKYSVQDVFTPTRPARIAFVERDSVNDKLVNSLTTPGKQVVVYGHSGTGKTTLLANKLTQLYEFNITTRCMKGMTFEQLILDAFDQLEPYFSAERSSALKTTTGVDLSATYKMLQAKISSQTTVEATEKQNRMLPPQLTPQALGKFLGIHKACWVLEDFHKIDEAEKVELSQLMKVFMDLSDDYADLKIIALGAVDTARQVVDFDREMRNRVSEIHVSLMTEAEIYAIIEKGEKALNVRFSESIKKLIATHSNGLASVCHQLCLNMCHAAGLVETVDGEPKPLTDEHLEKAVKTYIEEVSDSIKSAFDKALKQRRKTQYPNAEVIIRALSSVESLGAARADILKKIRATESKYPEANLKYMLLKLCTAEYGEIVRFDSNSGLYSFSEPMYRVYAMAQFKQTSTKSKGGHINQLEAFLFQALAKELKLGNGKSFRITIEHPKEN
jgi:GTPase SAR1 family protein